MKPYNSKRKIKYYNYPHLLTSKEIKNETNKLNANLEIKYNNNKFILINYKKRLSLLNSFIKSNSFSVKKNYFYFIYIFYFIFFF